MEVIRSTSSRKKQIPYLVEVEFRDQFEIAKPCEEYRKLLSLLPEYYIGKVDYLNAVVRIVCGAAKRSMKEKKIHMGPWRETSFMLMKWSKPPLTEPSEKFRPISSRFSSAPPAVEVTWVRNREILVSLGFWKFCFGGFMAWRIIRLLLLLLPFCVLGRRGIVVVTCNGTHNGFCKL